jgi:FixJ family two-component response regulator
MTSFVARPLLIAIVDDDPSFRRATRGFIQSLGYDVMAFGSGEEFLASPKLVKTACLICDLHMPSLSGIELQKRLRALGYAFPVIFITAHAEAKTRREALASGAVGFFGKPFPEQEFISCLERVSPW